MPLPEAEIEEVLARIAAGSPHVSPSLRQAIEEARHLFLRLNEENQELRRGVFRLETDRAVRAPEPFVPLFDAAQRTVHEYFRTFKASPSRGHVEIAGERYLLIRASALSVDFFQTIRQLYADRGDMEAFAIGQRFLFDIAHAIGMSDARAFHVKMGLADPAARLSAGPVHFAYAGWAYVDISPESRPAPDESYFLTYSHPYSFEADSWIRAGMESAQPVCIMSAGYSSGWCEESFGMGLTAVEVTCRARGDESCTFIMAPPHRIQEHLADKLRKRTCHGGAAEAVRVPRFFESKLMEEEVKTKETRYRELFAHMSDGVVVYEAVDGGRDFLFKDINHAAMRTEQVAREEVVGRRLAEVFPAAEEFGMIEVLRRVYSTGRAEAIPARFYQDSRISGWRENFVYRLPTNDVVAVYRDVSEQKMFEEQLRASEGRLTTILEKMPVGVAIVDSKHQILWLNEALRGMIGVTTKEEVISQRCSDAICGAGSALSKESGEAQREGRLLRGDGKELFVLQTVHEIVVDGKQQTLYVFVDITHRKGLESELNHARKLEAVGQLAAGIAHEINTPAQFVGDSIDFLSASFKDMTSLVSRYHDTIEQLACEPVRGPLLQVLREAEDAADLSYIVQNVPAAFGRARDGVDRIASIVGAMKEFSHPDQREKSRADLNRALQATLAIARNEYKYVAEVETELGELPAVMCHVGDLNQVFLNLLVNAAHAISDVVKQFGGKGKIRVRSRMDGEKVCIEIADSGCGIPEEIRERVFDPFFTTKEVGRGSGQGLAIARSIIVDKHGGSLTFTSKVGHGTTFTILIPVD
jgi:PAS domain S-box-containing protein